MRRLVSGVGHYATGFLMKNKLDIGLGEGIVCGRHKTIAYI